MKKKYAIFTVIIFILLVTTFTYFNTLKQNNIYKENIENNQTKITKGISMNLEQTAGAGDYKTVTQSGWPTEGYKFNSELSRCENGSTLSWDDTKKAVIVSGNSSDKCYVYFDIIPTLSIICSSGENLSTCIKKYGDAGPVAPNIYIHNANLTNGAGDNSYRFAGANPNNYVCFGSDATTCPTDNLYRIIGVIDNKVKLIKADFASSTLLGTNGDYGYSSSPASTYKGSLTQIEGYYWNKSSEQNTWSISSLNKTNLNTNFINNIGTTWSNKIATTKWKVGEGDFSNFVPKIVYQNEIVNPQAGQYSTTGETEYSAKIGLIYVSDYGFATIPDAWTLTMYNYNNSTAINNNWLYLGVNEFTITPMTTAVDCVNSISYDAKLITGFVGMDSNGVRPVFNLESSVTYVSGDGTQSSPIRIN